MLEQVNAEYQQLLAREPEKYNQDFKRVCKELGEEEIYYNGEVIPILYQPLFFGQKAIDNFNKLVNGLGSILKKVIDRYLIDEDFRSYFGFSQKLEELILMDPGYNNPVPMGRFDIFYYGQGNFKFCELNADGSSGMVKTNTLEEIFLQSAGIQDLTQKHGYDFSYHELLQSWIDTMLNNYEKFDSDIVKPNIAIMDFNNLGMVSEFEYFKELLTEQGYEVVIVDPRELEYNEDKLYYQETRIDLIYRRAVTTDIMKRYSEVKDLLKAYQDQAVCIVGSFRSQIIHNKIIFAILHDEEKTNFLNENDREFINKYIPKTDIISSNKEKLEHIRRNREGLVLKPLDFYGATGVHIGCDLTQDEWGERLNGIKPGEYLVQEFCRIPEEDMVVFDNNQLKIESFKYTLGLFAYDLSFAGIYTRAGKENLIASSTGCVTLPNLILDEGYTYSNKE
ncbi:glutathionylspermidine synthase family protein [Selenihalanaerobacter shriftii]|uniref:Glutathionylspermidine synthase preATP-grasp n=1 Tax=Selenihalanaerobacter shriftii TaxID=142842 RepID=A0A1T4K673_9FIRM|nr:glutathionylspermidine synthase family protein [Selenihalanaerobacter shriftii]SJZ37911.1 Glutathionylspermidine synthase preATP-grasp [Selenihalanaerobacter shriftii]